MALGRRAVSLSLFVVLLGAASTFADHLEGGTIHWTRDTTFVSETHYRFDVTAEIGFRWSTAFIYPLMAPLGSTVTSTDFHFTVHGASGDYLLTTNRPGRVASISAPDDWMAVVFALELDLPKHEAPYRFVFSTAARRGTLRENNQDATMRLEAVVDPAGGDSSPRSVTVPNIVLHRSVAAALQLPVEPRTGATTGFATPALSGLRTPIPNGTDSCISGCPPGLPGSMTLSPTGLIQWTPQLLGLYAVQFSVAGSGQIRIPMDVYIKVVDGCSPGTPGCDSPPSITAFPDEVTGVAGEPISFPVSAADSNIGQFVTIVPSALPAGAALNPYPGPPGPSTTSTFSWTPLGADAGTYPLCFFAKDSAGTGSTGLSCMTVHVDPAPPRVICPAPLTVHASSANGADERIVFGVSSPNALPLQFELIVDGAVIPPSSTLQGPLAQTTITRDHRFPIGAHVVKGRVVDAIGERTCETSLTVSRLFQQIFFSLPATATFGDAPIALEASSSVGLPVSFEVFGPAHLDGTSLVIDGGGTVEVRAKQEGDSIYAPAERVAFIEVGRATPQIEIVLDQPSAVFDGTAYGATATVNGVGGAFVSLAAVTYDGSADRPVNAGTYPVEASFAGDQDYLPATTGGVTLVIEKGTPELTAPLPATIVYDAEPHPVAASVVGADGADLGAAAVHYDDAATADVENDTTAPMDAGQYRIIALYAGDANHVAAEQVVGTLTIKRASPSISVSVAPFPGNEYDAAPHPATATVLGVGGVEIGLADVTYDGSPDPPVNAGTYLVRASFDGNRNYLQAVDESFSFTIEKAPVHFDVPAQPPVLYDGQPHGVSGTVVAAYGEVGPATLAYDDTATSVVEESPEPPVDAGAYDVRGIYAGDANHRPANAVAGRIDILQATPLVQIANVDIHYDSLPHPAPASASGVLAEALGPVSVTYDGSPVVPVHGGTYAAVASFGGNRNYTAGTAEGTVLIRRVPLTVKANDAAKRQGDPNPPFMATFTGLVGTDSFPPAFVTTATVDSPVGTYPIAVVPFASPSYDITLLDGVLTILPRRELCVATDLTKEVRGAALNLRLQLCDGEGTNISSPDLVLKAFQLVAENGQTYPVSSRGARTDGTFEYRGEHYQLVLNLAGVPPGRYRMELTVSDEPTVYSVEFTRR